MNRSSLMVRRLYTKVAPWFLSSHVRLSCRGCLAFGRRGSSTRWDNRRLALGRRRRRCSRCLALGRHRRKRRRRCRRRCPPLA